MLLHTLRGQYEAIHGEPDVVFRKQQQFRSSPIWGQNKMEIRSTKMAFSALCLEKTMHEGFHS